MILDQDLPYFLSVCGCQCRLWYRGQPLLRFVVVSWVNGPSPAHRRAGSVTVIKSAIMPESVRKPGTCLLLLSFLTIFLLMIQVCLIVLQLLKMIVFLKLILSIIHLILHLPLICLWIIHLILNLLLIFLIFQSSVVCWSCFR